jgi:predicted ester cyclase/ketosteroid isomerase-like protein
MSTESNKELVRRFLEGMWNYEKLESLAEFVTPDYAFHDSVGDLRGIREFRSELAEELEAFSDVLVTIDDIVGEGDRVAVRYTSSYLHHGEFMHAYPTGALTVLRGVSIHRIVGGKIAESWDAYDRRALARHVGAEQRLTDQDEVAIRNTVEEALKIGFADRPTLAKVYWAEGAEIVAANGEVIRGHHAVLDWLQRFPPVLNWRLFDLTVDGAGEFACVRGRYLMELSSRAKVPYDKGQYMEIWRKQGDGSWKVIRHVYTSELATRSKARTTAAQV